jgi:hypothetical protein
MEILQDKSGANNKTFEVFSSFKEAEDAEKAFWFSQNPNSRIEHIELLRKINYGNDASKRLQRILEIARRA